MIELNGVSKWYGQEKAVDALSLKIPQGIVFGFLGPNGAGKTTTIKMLVGLARPDSGEIRIGGKEPADVSLRRITGFMPENPSFYDYLTGMEFLRFMYDLSGRSNDKRHTLRQMNANGVLLAYRASKRVASNPASIGLEEIFKKAGIYDARDKTIRHYSKGMRQRLAFAQAIVHDPEYIFLDEPLDGLDPLGRREVKQIIKELNADGKTVFFNSHILADVEEICDEIGVIHRGKLLYMGGVREFCKGMALEEQFVELISSTNNESVANKRIGK